MASKRSSRPAPSPGAVTPERAARLSRLVHLVGKRPQTREELMRRLRLDVRSFYRDLEVLRAAGIRLSLRDRRYELAEDPAAAAGRLPFPDPHLTLAEAGQLARGRTAAHQKVRKLVERIVNAR